MLRVWDGDVWHTWTVAPGTNLRRTLLEHGHTPYATITQVLNCGGRGLCATCGVRIDPPAPKPRHWHDKLAAQYGYPRLSCQIKVERDLTVRLLPDKIVWGKRKK